MTDPTPLTDAQVAELVELEKAATPGPWKRDRFFWKIGSTRGMADEFWVSVDAPDGSVVATMPEEAPPSPANAALIAAARNALPALLAELAQLRTALAEGREDGGRG